MKRFIHTCLFLVLSLCLYASYTPQSVPNPRLQQGYVSNPDNILSTSAVETINNLLLNLERQTEVQAAVVAIQSIGQADYTEFAYTLASTWGIGKKDKSTGILLLLVLDQRAVRIEVGNGLEGLLPDAACEQILQNDLFPFFQIGNYDQGFIRGATTIHDRLTQDEAKAELLLQREYAPQRLWVNVLVYYFIMAFLLWILFAWWGWQIMNARPKAANNIRYAHAQSYVQTCWIVGILFPIPLLLWALYIKSQHQKMRNTPIKCPECKHLMTLLSESEEDVHLSQKQQTEEKLQSINYDVWECKHCYNHIILPYLKTRTPYSECTHCHALACSLHADVVLRQATSLHNGLGERTYICHHCGKQFVSTYTIPKLPVVVVGGGSSSSGGGFSGGSWGGGSFSGGGAGGHF